MELIRREMPGNYQLIDCGDFHYGALNCAKDKLRSMVDYIASTSDCYVVIKGDAIEAILPNDKRYASCSIDWKDKLITPMEQADALVELFRPIRHKILVWLIGNHEYKLINTINMGKYITDKLGIPEIYGGVHCKFTALDHKGKCRHKFYFHHGSGKITSQAKDDIQALANMQAKLKLKLVESKHTDCIYMSMAHIHKALLVPPTVNSHIMLTDNGKHVRQQHRHWTKQNAEYIPPECRWYTSSPSFLKCLSPMGSGALSYSEIAMYGPTELGWLRLTVENHELVDVEKVVS